MSGIDMDMKKDTTQTASTTAIAVVDRGVEIWKIADLSVIREGSPLQVKQKLDDLVSEGHLSLDDPVLEGEIVDEDLLKNDAEIEIIDEDAGGFDVWNEKADREGRLQGEIVLKSDQDSGIKESAIVLQQDFFEIITLEDGVVFSIPDWVADYRVETGHGNKAVYELDRRIGVLEGLARWLGDERKEFLREMTWLCLGPRDFDEVSRKVVTITQKALVETLARIYNVKNVDESVFSRHISACRIVNSRGSIPLKDFFSKDARMGWVAKSVMLFLKEKNISASMLQKDTYKDIKKPRAREESDRYLRNDVRSMDLGDFIVYVNIAAGTSWDDVWTAHFKEDK